MYKKNPNLIFLVLAAILTTFLFITVVALSFTNLLFGNKKATPAIVNQSDKNGSGFSTNLTKNEKKGLEDSYGVTKLIYKTPYNGKNFSFYYSYADNVFTLYVPPGKETEGNLEFDKFLKDNGVNDRSLITNLTTVSIKPTPGS